MKLHCAVLGFLLLGGCGRDEAARQDAARQDAARQAMQSFGSALLAELQAAIAAGGAVEAIAVCSERAPAIAEAAARDGLSVRRIGTRVRNHATNVPTADERAILARFAELPEDRRATALEEHVHGGQVAYYAPIFIGSPLCLSCHGPAESLAPEVRSAIAARYPGDEATGYTLGDLRGAFVVEGARR